MIESRKGRFVRRVMHDYFPWFTSMVMNTNPNAPWTYSFDGNTTINDIRQLTLDYVQKLRVTEKGKFAGYRYSTSTDRPVLYATLAAMLVKHLYGHQDDTAEEEINLVLAAQSDDGLFRDPVIRCRQAETGDSWGWRHLTLHALMTLALYGRTARKEIKYAQQFYAPDSLLSYLRSRDWGAGVVETSNEIQNLGVMLQYARDYQGDSRAGEAMNVLYDFLESKQDPETGMYGDSLACNTPSEISLGCQVGYHLWLLYFYDSRPVNHMDRIIDKLLLTQNTLGGYGVKWNSSACEDIDSIDPLVRFSRLTGHRHDDIQASLRRALPAVLANLNGDGGWVFRRHEALCAVHPQMYSAMNESNIFYTWFRTLGLAYLLTGLENVPASLKYPWNFARAPGHQFLVSA